MNDEVMFASRDETTDGDFRGLTPDSRFKLLKNSRRRKILAYLSESDKPTTRSELAEIIAAEENGIAVSDLSSDQRKRVYVSLYQTHLPALKRDDAIRYDADRGIIEPGPNMEELIQYLRAPPDTDDTSSSTRFLWLSLLGGVSYVLLRIAVGGMLGLTDLWALVFVAAVFLLSMNLRQRSGEGSHRSHP